MTQIAIIACYFAILVSFTQFNNNKKCTNKKKLKHLCTTLSDKKNSSSVYTKALNNTKIIKLLSKNKKNWNQISKIIIHECMP